MRSMRQVVAPGQDPAPADLRVLPGLMRAAIGRRRILGEAVKGSGTWLSGAQLA